MSKWRTTDFCETCAKEFCCTHECKYHLLHRIKEAREEIENKYDSSINSWCEREEGRNEMIDEVLIILDKLIAESEK